MIKFSKWLEEKEKQVSEVSTCTGEVAHFQRRFFDGAARRKFLDPVAVDGETKTDSEDNRKKK